MPTHPCNDVIAAQIKNATLVICGNGTARRILDCVSAVIYPGEFIGVLGASGSGKSTMLKSLAGLVSLTDGSIIIDGVATSAASLRLDRRIAYLPQDVIIHEALTPIQALYYVAQLKGLFDTSANTKRPLLSALARVGLADRGDVPICRLSGGQRKRVALAAELLGDPQLILLDEATSGLDPATEAEMMNLFRTLADEGRSVVCITHFPGRLHLCDRVIGLKDGMLVFDGTPIVLKAFFAIEHLEELYGRLEQSSAGDWRERFHATNPPSPEVASAQSSPPTLAPHVSFTNQLMILLSRYARLQLVDWPALSLQLVQAPIIGLMIAASFGDIRGSFAEQAATDSKLVLFTLTLAVLWCSGTASAREVVKEMPIVRHELRFGLDLRSYLGSKFIWLGGLAIVQAAILLFTVRYFTRLTGPADLQLAILALLGLVGVALGLCISATAGTSEQAMTVLPVALIGLAIFSSGLARLVGVPLWAAWVASPSYWALDGLKAPLSSGLKNATYPGAPGTYQPPILGSGGPLMLDAAALVLQAITLLALAFTVLRLSQHRSAR